MSTGANCYFLEAEPSKWYYILEDYNAPKNAWDWLEYAKAYGSFGSMEQARTHLHKYHANPGGYSVEAYEEGYTLSEREAELIADAKKNTRLFASPLHVQQRFGRPSQW